MRRLILLSAAAVVVAAATGAAAWRYLRPQDPLAEARQLIAQGDLRAAQLVLRSAVQADPGRTEAHLRLGQMQLALGDPTAAEKELRAAREHGADAKVVTPLLARAVAEQHRDAEVLRDYPPDGLEPAQAASVLVWRAKAQQALHQPAAAAASMAQAQQLAPKSVEVALAAASLALANGNPGAAETQVGAALAIDASSLQALLLQAELRAARGDLPGALASYDSAVAQATAAGPGAAGGLDTIRLARAGLLVAINDNRARADVDAVLKAQPKNPLAHYLLAQLAARAQDWKAADAALSAVGPVLARLPRADLLLALVKVHVGEPEQALAAAERQVARAPDDLAALKLLARLHLTQQRPEKAAEILAAAAAAGHSDAETLTLMGQIYASSGKPQEALDSIQKASALAPDDTRLLTRLAALQLREGNSSQATQSLERALDLAPDAPVAPVAGAAMPAAPGGQPAVSASVTPTPPGPPLAGPPAPPSKAQTAATLVAVALQAGEIDHAVAALDRLRQAKGDPEQLALLTGLVHLAQIDLPGARAAFEEARKIDPASVRARINLARVLALQGHPDEAAALLDEALATDRSNTAVLGALVNVRLAEHQPDQAVAAAEAAHAAKPDDTGILAGLADLYTSIGQPAKALALLNGAQNVNGPQNGDQQLPALVAARVRAQLSSGQRAEAVVGLRAVLQRMPDDSPLRRQLAELLAANKDFDGAKALLREGLARRPADPVLLATTIAIAGREGGPGAASALAAALAADPANGPVAKQLQADLLFGQRQYAAAAAAYQALLAALPADSAEAEPLVVRAAGAVATGGDPAQAAAMLRDWLAAHPASPAAAMALSGLDIGANRLPDAAAHLQTVLASQPNNPTALNNLAWVSQQQGDLERAHALASRGYLLSPTPQAADTLGLVMLNQPSQSARPGAALALLREAANGLPGDPAIQYHLAEALARDGQKEAARSALQALLTAGSGKPAAAFADKPAAEKLLHDLAAP